ncbi:oxidation resistance protein 1-like isoform X1 [Centruroides vittatus]|uniref:oxidation resistance protein 1-like isoform X1 n=1 Tax=Centruroides vittatus TaxID=120091 RepID=UPI00351067F8
MSKQSESLPKKPLTHTLSQPIETVNYTVSSSDTLLGIAARFDTTPSELTKLNKLTCGLIFPGQKILVPKKADVLENKSDQASLPKVQEKGENKIKSPVSCETTLVVTENDKRSNSHTESGKNESVPRFLKISSRYITDGQGVVCGVLIVTPNAIMFDPNVSDPLVMEHSVENYGVIASLDMVMRAAIYYDIAHMAVSHLNEVPRNIPKPEMYVKPKPTPSQKDEGYSGANNSNSQVSLNLKESTRIFDESDQNKADNENLARIRKIKSSDNVKEQVCSVVEKMPDSKKQSDQDKNNLLKVHRANSCCEPLERLQTETIKEQISKQFSFPLQSHVQQSKLTSERTNYDYNKESKIKDLNHIDANKSQSYTLSHEENSDLRKLKSSILSSFNCMNLDDTMKSHLFESLDEIIPLVRPATSGFPPLYLCLRMGHPVNKKVAKSSPFLNYHKKRLKREYWFSISRDKVDEVYDFFQYWAPHLYGDITDIDPEKLGFIPINEEEEDDDIELLDEEITQESGKSFEGAMKLIRSSPLSILKVVEDHFGGNNITKEDWEFLSMNESNTSPSAESAEILLPDLSEQSDILNDKEKRELCKHLPARALGYCWTLIYSTSKHGFSLKTLYRKMSNVESPVLLTISDTNGAVFGAMSSCPLKISEHFYGTGESFLYSFYNGFKHYPWSGENMYFIKGNIESLAFGAGEGQFGLWLDGDLYHGRSSKCKTYNNDCLSSQEDFVIKALEAWGFV